jgi:hypothetical protein
MSLYMLMYLIALVVGHWALISKGVFHGLRPDSYRDSCLFAQGLLVDHYSFVYVVFLPLALLPLPGGITLLVQGY